MTARPDDSWTTFSSPAKINLFLHITGRRPDGYHNLQTLFRRLIMEIRYISVAMTVAIFVY